MTGSIGCDQVIFGFATYSTICFVAQRISFSGAAFLPLISSFFMVTNAVPRVWVGSICVEMSLSSRTGTCCLKLRTWIAIYSTRNDKHNQTGRTSRHAIRSADTPARHHGPDASTRQYTMQVRTRSSSCQYRRKGCWNPHLLWSRTISSAVQPMHPAFPVADHYETTKLARSRQENVSSLFNWSASSQPAEWSVMAET